GKKTGPCKLRSTASASAHTRMNTSAMQKYTMLRRNAQTMSGNDLRNSSPLKNSCFTAGQLGDDVTAQTISPATTTVLTTAMTTPRAPSARRGPRILDDGSPSGSLGSPGWYW